jgi:hypothetical protein
MVAGDMMTLPSGAAFSPGPGVVDAVFLDASGANLDGVLARVSFATIAPGDPGIRIDAVDAAMPTTSRSRSPWSRARRSSCSRP